MNVTWLPRGTLTACGDTPFDRIVMVAAGVGDGALDESPPHEAEAAASAAANTKAARNRPVGKVKRTYARY